MRFTSLVLKNLTRRRFRTALTLAALSLAVASVVSLRGIAKGFTRSFAGIYESHAVDVVVSRQGTADRVSSSIAESSSQKIESVTGVDRADGVLLETLSLEDQQIYGIPTMGIAQGSWLRDDFQWLDQPAEKVDKESNETLAGVLSLGVNLADRAGLQAGDTVNLFEEPYRVSGIFESASVWENGALLMPLRQLQTLTDRSGQVTYINVVLDRDVQSQQAEEVLRAIEAIDPKLNALATEMFVETDTRMKLASAMAWMTSMIALAIGAVSTLNTMMTSVLERTREIGVLRAVGWSRRRVTWMILSESLLLAILATLVGGCLAWLATNAMSRHPVVRGILVPSVDGGCLVEGAVLAVLIGLAGAMLPARRAASIMPSEAIRSI